MPFAENLKQYRLLRRLTQKELGEISGISPVIIHRYEHGTNEPRLSRIIWLAGALGVKPGELID